MLQQDLNQAIAWYTNLSPMVKKDLIYTLLTSINLKEERDNYPTTTSVRNYIKRSSALKVFNDISVQESTELTPYKANNNIIDFNIIQYFEQLIILHVYRAEKFINLSSLNRLKNLSAIHLTDCKDISAFINYRNNESLLSMYIHDCNNFNLSSLLNISKLDKIDLFQCKGVIFKTHQCYNYVKEICIVNCYNVDIELDFALYPHLTTILIRDNQGTLTIKNGTKSTDLYRVDIQQIDSLDIFTELLKQDNPQPIELTYPCKTGKENETIK